MEKLELNSNNNVKREETEKSAEEAASDFGLDHRLADDIVSEKEEAGAEKERFKRRAQELVDGKRFDFELFAESAAPRFRFSDGFYMLFEKKEVHMNADWFADRKFSDQQLLWATYHELAHFYDFADDHKAILKKFEQMQESARKTGTALAEKYTKLHNGALPKEATEWFKQKPINLKRPEKGTMNRFEQIAYGIHHNFWNCLDDIYVNSLVAKRKAAYGVSGQHAKEVEKLYREQLFKEADFSSLPRHKQLAYVLLRREMALGEKTVVSEEIETILNRKHLVLGKEYTAEELIREFIKARNTLGVKASTRYGILEKTLAPVFEEFLNKDIADWQLPESQESPEEQKEKSSQEGQGESESGDQAGEQSNGQEEGQSDERSQEDKPAGSDQEEEPAGQTSEEGGQSGTEQSADGQEGQEQKGVKGQEEGEQASETEGEDGASADGGEDGQKNKKPSQSFSENINDAFNPGKKGAPGELGESGGPGGDGPTIPFPAQSPEDIKDIAEQFKKWEKEWQDARHKEQEARKEEPAENREKRLKKSRDEAWCEQYDVDYETFSRYGEVERKIKPYLAALDALWQRIIYGSSRETKVQSVGYFKEGEELDVGEAVREFPKILSGELDKVRVMRRDESVREMAYRPELIRVRFVGDASGSMGDDRREILEQAFVLIFSSLRRFETYLNLTRGKTKSKLSVDTEAWVFGSSAERVKPFRGRGGYDREKAKIIRSFGGLRKDRVGTRDDKALSAIAESLTPEEEKKIKSEKIMELVFELTDGGTNSEGIAAAKEALAELDEKAVITRAFQIGTTDESEQEIFNDVWNTDQNGALLRERRGEIVGAEIKNLIPALTRALAKYLSQVEL